MPISRGTLKTYMVPRSKMVENKSKKADENKYSPYNNMYPMKAGREKKS